MLGRDVFNEIFSKRVTPTRIQDMTTYEAVTNICALSLIAILIKTENTIIVSVLLLLSMNLSVSAA